MTEYGYETSPPDPTSLFTPAQQAQYMGWSTYLAHSQPGTRMFAQFLLRDIEPQPGRGWRDFQTGLFFDNWRAEAERVGVQDPALRLLHARAGRVACSDALRRRAPG